LRYLIEIKPFTFATIRYFMIVQSGLFPQKFYVAGISFKKTDTEHRSKFSITPEQTLKAYGQSSNCLPHYLILSTCNRTEIYGFAPCEYVLLSFIQSLSGASQEEVAQHAYSKEGNDAIEHLLHVAAGLDSQIPGDYEIIGQIRNAFRASKESGRSNGFIERAVNQANQVSKAIKNNTAFSDGTISVSYSVAKQITKIIHAEGLKKVCVVGLGKIGHGTLRYLKQQAPQTEIILVNRDEKKLADFGKQYSSMTFPFVSLDKAVEESDIVIVATSVARPILYLEQIKNTAVRYVFDLSMPRNVADDIYQYKGVTVFDVDQISTSVNETFGKRMAELPKVKAIVKEKAREFFDWQQRRKLRTTSLDHSSSLGVSTILSGKNLIPHHVIAHRENSHAHQRTCFMADQCCEVKTGSPWLARAARSA
jgi:glutamyl-tRNA reductase